MDVSHRIERYARQLASDSATIQRDAKTRDDYRVEMQALVWQIESRADVEKKDRYTSTALRYYVVSQIRARSYRERWERPFTFEPDWAWWGPTYEEDKRHEASLILGKLAELIDAHSYRVLSAMATHESLSEARDEVKPSMPLPTFHYAVRRARRAAARALA